jgi:hypothetical protein
VIHGNHCLIVQEVPDEVGISTGSCHKIVTERFEMCHVSAKFVPHLLSDVQKENHLEFSQELLANANGNENFLMNIITANESRVYGHDDETKMQSLQWMG